MPVPFENAIPRMRAAMGRFRSAWNVAFGRADVVGSVKATEGERKSLATPRARKKRHQADEEWLKQVNESAILRIPLNRIVTDVAAVRWRVYRVGDSGPDGEPEKVEVRGHKLNALWTRPNPHMTGTQFRKLCATYKIVSGVIAMRVFYDADGHPESLWPIPRHHVIEMPSISNPPKSTDKPFWKIRWMGKEELVHPECIIWITEPDPADPYGWGIGDVTCLAALVRLSKSMDEWSGSMFRNGAQIGKIIGIPGLDPDRMDEMEQDLDVNHTGTENVGRSMLVALKDGSPAISVVDLGKDHKDLDWVLGQKHAGDRARHVLNMPPECVGDVTNSNRATSDSADYHEAKNNVRPMLLFFAEQFNVWLVPLFGEPDLLLEPDECVKETADQRHAFLMDGWRNGTITRDKWLIGHGFDPVGGTMGRQIMFQTNCAFMDVDGGPIIAAAQKALPSVAEDGGSATDGDAEKHFWQRTLDDILLHPDQNEQEKLLGWYRMQQAARGNGNGKAAAYR